MEAPCSAELLDAGGPGGEIRTGSEKLQTLRRRQRINRGRPAKGEEQILPAL